MSKDSLHITGTPLSPPKLSSQRVEYQFKEQSIKLKRWRKKTNSPYSQLKINNESVHFNGSPLKRMMFRPEKQMKRFISPVIQPTDTAKHHQSERRANKITLQTEDDQSFFDFSIRSMAFPTIAHLRIPLSLKEQIQGKHRYYVEQSALIGSERTLEKPAFSKALPYKSSKHQGIHKKKSSIFESVQPVSNKIMPQQSDLSPEALGQKMDRLQKLFSKSLKAEIRQNLKINFTRIEFPILGRFCKADRSIKRYKTEVENKSNRKPSLPNQQISQL